MARQIDFKYILGLDCETSGIVTKSRNPATDQENPSYYAQPVSWGMVILDSKTLKTIDKLYIEIKWDGKSIWNAGAEKVHGLSKDYLEENGVSEEEAVVTIGNWLIKYFGKDAIVALGHNVRFDEEFLLAMFARHGVKIAFSNRKIDSMGIGAIFLNARNSDELFEMVGLDARQDHNALEDIEMTVQSVRILRRIFNIGMETL